jgi:putative effector of murein hydrolase
MWVLLTVVVFFFARSVARKFNSPIPNPLVISVSIIIPVLYPSDLKMLVSARIKWLSDKAPI